jgi:membrane protein DedA with SNARE-associated domain
MLTINHIKDFALLHADIAYILIILGVILEGEIVVILAGIFAHLGSLNIFVAFGAIFLAGGIKSIIGYTLGNYLKNNHSQLPAVCKVKDRISRFLPHFNDRPFLSIFLSRFLVFGIYWFALIFAGFKKTKLRTFIRAEIASLVTWTIVMLSLGYFFSYTALSISRDVRNFLGLILLFFIGFFILEKIVGFFVKLFENKYL